MAQYAQQAKNILSEIGPDFMVLNSIETPPIDFADALLRARRAIVSELTRLVPLNHSTSSTMTTTTAAAAAAAATAADGFGDGESSNSSQIGDGSVTTTSIGRPDNNEVRRIIRANVRVTFTYLLMQLHVRGGSKFWRNVDSNQLFAYLAFRTIDQYCDVITHAQDRGIDAHFQLKDLVTMERINALRSEFIQLFGILAQQRALHAEEADWHPEELDVQRAMGRHADKNLLSAVRETGARAATMAIGTVLVVAAAAFIYRRWSH